MSGERLPRPYPATAGSGADRVKTLRPRQVRTSQPAIPGSALPGPRAPVAPGEGREKFVRVDRFTADAGADP